MLICMGGGKIELSLTEAATKENGNMLCILPISIELMSQRYNHFWNTQN